MSQVYAALEIGTTRTVLALGEAVEGGRLKVICHAEVPSTGVRKSQILDINQATQSIRVVLSKSERLQSEMGSSISIGNVVLLVSGQHVKTDFFQGTARLEGDRVTQDDIDEVIRTSRQMSLPRGRELLDIVDQAYGLDNFQGIESPKGMSGSVLKLDTIQISADENRINDARTAAEAAHLEIREPLFAATCAAEATLSEHEKRDGALVLDLGGGSTGYAAYGDGHLLATGVIGVGGDHITNDIAHAFQPTQAQAEALKINEASAVFSADGMPARVRIGGNSALMETRTISRRALDTVVNARCRELIEIIRYTLEYHNLSQNLHSGVILTGGGAALKGLDALMQHELGMNVKIGRPIQIDGLDDDPHPEALAAISGALLYSLQNFEEKSIFQTIFGVFKKK